MTGQTSSAARSGQAWLFVECIAIASWMRHGDPISLIAARLKRRIPEVRRAIYGAAA